MATGSSSRFGLGIVYANAGEEARRRGDRRVGTEHIALALLRDPQSPPAQALAVSLPEARAALEELDRQALAALGIGAEPVGREKTGGDKERLRLTPAGREVFTRLRRVAAGERLGGKHVLLALLTSDRPDPAAELFSALGIDAAQVRARLDQP